MIALEARRSAEPFTARHRHSRIAATLTYDHAAAGVVYLHWPMHGLVAFRLDAHDDVDPRKSRQAGQATSSRLIDWIVDADGLPRLRELAEQDAAKARAARADRRWMTGRELTAHDDEQARAARADRRWRTG